MSSQYSDAVQAMRAQNAEDPRLCADDEGTLRPRELVQSERLVRWVAELWPDAPEALRLAAHCQHIRRWERPRSMAPEGRDGYRRWRVELAQFHADTACTLLGDFGYPEDTQAQVRKIIQKQGISRDPLVQTMEDALCLVFLETEFEPLLDAHSEDKLCDILRKTWKKMSDAGHRAALTVPLSDRASQCLKRALAPSES